MTVTSFVFTKGPDALFYDKVYRLVGVLLEKIQTICVGHFSWKTIRHITEYGPNVKGKELYPRD